jgi:hypothetical protein
MKMRISAGGHDYEWLEPWVIPAQVLEPDAAGEGWAHPGMAVTPDGLVITAHPGVPALLLYNPAGQLQRAISGEQAALTEAHGITAIAEGDQTYLWVADNGAKWVPGTTNEQRRGPRGGQVAKLSLDGRVILRLGAPNQPRYDEGRFSPTSVAVHRRDTGGTGDVWVADGYGQSCVHRYDHRGAHLGTITGEEGAGGVFRTPHAVFVDTRRDEPELLIADRSNRQVQVYDLEGRFRRTFGAEYLNSPSAFAVDGDVLIVGELRARLALIDLDDRLIGYLGEDPSAPEQQGWPNARTADGAPTRAAGLAPGKLHSPHGLAADAGGSLYVAEWLIGGRYVKLAKAA